MGIVTVVNHLTLDGVMQAPAHADEDRRGGFEHGGWAAVNMDEVMGRTLGESMARGPGSLLLGRRTYEDLAGYWPHRTDEDPVARVINAQTKWVASRTLAEPLAWRNSRLLQGDVPEAVTRLRDESDESLTILGSGELIRALMPHGLIDAWLVMIHPVVAGRGIRMFGGDGAFAGLRLVDSVITTTGVVMARYERAD
jgi:dihydrofolate reductase